MTAALKVVRAGLFDTLQDLGRMGFMALGMMLPGMAAGWIQSQLGYLGFFVWVCVATLPSFLATALVRIDPGFGAKP